VGRNPAAQVHWCEFEETNQSPMSFQAHTSGKSGDEGPRSEELIMRKFKFIALIGASALAVSAASTVTAQAQPWRYHAVASDSRLTTSYVDSLDWKITNAAQRGLISWNEARDLRAELRSVQPLAYRNQTGQARPFEIRRLENTVSRIEAATSRYAANDRRYDRGYWRR